jgi:adenylate cyclase class 2
MLEIETKFKSPGNDKVEKALARLGAKSIGEHGMEDIYFSHVAKDFGKSDEALRLRKTENGFELTYKGPRLAVEGSKAREEVSVNVGDALAAQRLLERLGFKEYLVIRKTRKSFMLGELRVDLDDVDGLGEYVEIEVLTESPEQSDKAKEIAEKELGLDKLERRTYLEMILDRANPKGR